MWWSGLRTFLQVFRAQQFLSCPPSMVDFSGSLNKKNFAPLCVNLQLYLTVGGVSFLYLLRPAGSPLPPSDGASAHFSLFPLITSNHTNSVWCERGRGDEPQQVYLLESSQVILPGQSSAQPRAVTECRWLRASVEFRPELEPSASAGDGQQVTVSVSSLLCHVEFSAARLGSITLSVTGFKRVALQLNKLSVFIQRHTRRSETRSDLNLDQFTLGSLTGNIRPECFAAWWSPKEFNMKLINEWCEMSEWHCNMWNNLKHYYKMISSFLSE